MANATTNIVKTDPTNVQWPHCGPPSPEVKKLLSELNTVAKKSRIEWLKTLCAEPLPAGPFPFHLEDRGWFQGYIVQKERYQVGLVIREDLNLDVQVYESIRDHITGDLMRCVPIQDKDIRIGIRVCKVDLWRGFKELYPQEYGKIEAVWEFAQTTVETLEALIAREGQLWTEYDIETNENLKLMKQVRSGPNQGELICRGIADEKLILEAMHKDAKVRDEALVLHLQKRALAAEKAIKEAKNRPKVSRAKRALPFTEKSVPDVPAYKRPKVRFVSKLDKAAAALDAVNKQVGSTLSLMKKLDDKKAFLKNLTKKPKKIAGPMFKLLSREDLENIAVKLAQNCAVDALEEVLEGYREQTLIAVRKEYNEHVRQSIVANNILAQVKKEVEVDNEELGENAADAIPILEDSQEEPGDITDVGSPEDGPPKDGPPVVTSPVDGSQEDGSQEDGPQEDGPPEEGPPEDGPPDDMTTPVAREHWITSTRSSTGYKGVSFESSSGRFRIKHGGNTLARRSTLDEACSYFYHWCVAHDIIKDFRLV